jgi:hypothetical protein
MENDNVINITLPNGYSTLIDARDHSLLIKYKWYFDSGYVKRAYWDRKLKKVMHIKLHQELLKPIKGQIIDHINRNTLDNRRSNLRMCSASLNSFNKSCKIGVSGYRGVIVNRGCTKKKWLARITINTKRIILGSFINPKDAAFAYQSAAQKYARI